MRQGLHVERIGADVADVRIGERDDLPQVGRIGEDLLVAGEGGIEDDLSGGAARCADGGAAEGRAIREREHCVDQASLPGRDDGDPRRKDPRCKRGCRMRKAGGILANASRLAWD
jgi:hypothetical protein